MRGELWVGPAYPQRPPLTLRRAEFAPAAGANPRSRVGDFQLAAFDVLRGPGL